MKLRRSQFSILNKEGKEIDYINEVYKKKPHDEIETYKNPEDEVKRDTIQSEEILELDKISI